MLIVCAMAAYADSPLTSVDWATAYADLPAVAKAKTEGLPAVMPALLGDLPVDQKLAVVGALGWGQKERAMRIATAMARKRKVSVDNLQLNQLSSTDRAVLAYALALGDYFELSALRPGARGVLGLDAKALARSAVEARPDDFALAMVQALIVAQDQMDGSWCEVWRTWEALLARFPESRRNVRPGTVAAGTEYLRLYADDCPKPEPKPGSPPSDPQLDQVYDLVRYRDTLVTGTQGGLVVFGLDGRVLSWHKQDICSSLVVAHDEVWAGCYRDLLRFDGTRWTVVKHEDNPGEGGAFQVSAGADGAYVKAQGSLFRVGPQGGLQKVADIGDVYDVTVDSQGQRWTISFLQSVNGPHSYRVNSAAYPGRDPRSLVLGPEGALWVADFESGYFTYDRKRDSFVPFGAGPATRGSDLAIDRQRQRVWLLHYTEGLVLVSGGPNVNTVRRLSLGEFEYLRAIELDPDGSVWVAGWNGLAHVRLDGDGFSTTRFDAVPGR